MSVLDAKLTDVCLQHQVVGRVVDNECLHARLMAAEGRFAGAECIITHADRVVISNAWETTQVSCDVWPVCSPCADTANGTTFAMRVIADTEKSLAVTLRREFPDLLPSTDAWRPITKRCRDLIVQAIRSEMQ